MIWNLVLALHLLAAVVWVGGMVFALRILRPAMAFLEPGQRIALHRQVLRRFFFYVWHAMPIAIITGIALMVGLYPPGTQPPVAVRAMAGLAIVMGLLFVVIFFGPWRRMRQAPDDAAAAKALGQVRTLVIVNMWLGLLVVVVAAFVS